MELNIHIEEGFKFTSKNLDDYKKVNAVKERFPHIYAFQKPNNQIEQKLVDIDDINIPSYVDQEVRAGSNPARSELEKDINARGFSLDGLSLVLTHGKTKKYEPVDGVTKLDIFRQKGVVNAPVTIIPKISEADRYKLGIKLNHKDKPFGQASIEDVKRVIHKLHSLGDVKANGVSLSESINNTIKDMVGDKMPEGKLYDLVRDIEEEITKVKKLINLTPKTAAQRLEEIGCTSDSQHVYVPIASFHEKALSIATRAYANAVKEHGKDVQVRLVVYKGSIDPVNPVSDWNNKCRDFPKLYNKLLDDVGDMFFGAETFNTDKIQLYGAIPQVYQGLKDKNGDKISIKKLYRFK